MESQVQVLLDMLAMPTYFIPTLSVSQFGHRTYSAMTTFGQEDDPTHKPYMQFDSVKQGDMFVAQLTKKYKIIVGLGK